MHQVTRFVSLLTLSLAFATGAWAETKAKTKAPPASMPASAASAASAASGPMGCGMMTPPDCEKRQEEMKKIRETKDPAERQKLMQKHHKEMHDEHMGKGGMGQGGMGMGMGKGGMGMGASAPMMGASK